MLIKAKLSSTADDALLPAIKIHTVADSDEFFLLSHFIFQMFPD